MVKAPDSSFFSILRIRRVRIYRDMIESTPMEMMKGEMTSVVFIVMLFPASGRNLMTPLLLGKEKESHPLDTTFNPMGGQLLDEFLPRASWILAISLLCSVTRSL